jgi:hypothetical protein
LRAPGLAAWDLSVNKDTALPFLGEAGKVQARAEVFNVLNHANFSLPNERAFTGDTVAAAGASRAPAANVGKITTTSTSSRQIQLTLKPIF